MVLLKDIIVKGKNLSFFAISWNEGKGQLNSTHSLLPPYCFYPSFLPSFLLEAGPRVLKHALQPVWAAHRARWCCRLHCDSFHTSPARPFILQVVSLLLDWFLSLGWKENLSAFWRHLAGNKLLPPTTQNKKKRKSGMTLECLCSNLYRSFNLVVLKN